MSYIYIYDISSLKVNYDKMKIVEDPNIYKPSSRAV